MTERNMYQFLIVLTTVKICLLYIHLYTIYLIFPQHMKSFGITQTTKKTRKSSLKYMNGTFIILIIICFIFFTFFAKISGILSTKNKIDIFKEDL